MVNTVNFFQIKHSRRREAAIRAGPGPDGADEQTAHLRVGAGGWHGLHQIGEPFGLREDHGLHAHS